MIAITDHDNIDVINDISGNEEIKIIIGTEFSTMYNNENIHLLGYYKNNIPNNNIINYLKKLEKEREDRAKEILNRLDKIFNIKLNYDELKKFSNGVIGRPHVAKLIFNKYGINIETTFKKMIGDGCPCFIPASNQDLKKTIDFLHENDAIAILAHPIHYKKTSLEELIKLGIDGIECFYPEHKKKYSKKLVELSKYNNLIITGGSDFHDNKKYKKQKHGHIGQSVIEDEYLNLFLERLGIK